MVAVDFELIRGCANGATPSIPWLATRLEGLLEGTILPGMCTVDHRKDIGTLDEAADSSVDCSCEDSEATDSDCSSMDFSDSEQECP